MREQGREAQDEALLNPEAHDQDTAELLTWYGNEVVRLGRHAEAA